MSTITSGVDLAKDTFSLCEVNRSGLVLQRHDLRRDGYRVWLARLDRTDKSWTQGRDQSEDLDARGQAIMRPGLTGSLLRNS